MLTLFYCTFEKKPRQNILICTCTQESSAVVKPIRELIENPVYSEVDPNKLYLQTCKINLLLCDLARIYESIILSF